MESNTPQLDQLLAPRMPEQSAAPIAEAPISNAPVNVINPNGELVSVPQSQIESMDLFNNGYSEATPEAIQQAKYSTLPQQIGAGIEGLGEGIAGPLFTGAERLAGVSGEGILGRKEANPGIHIASQAAGLGLGAFTGTGEARLLTEAGELGSKALGLGLEGAGNVSKIGSSAVKAAIENGIFQSGDEASKFLAGDPNQSTDTAISNIGFSTLLGGVFGAGFGSIPPLWHATVGSKAANLLQSVADHAGGIEGQTADHVNKAITASQLTVPAEIRAVLSESPKAQEYFKDLRQSPTSSGVELAKTAENFRNEISEGIAKTSGFTPSEVQSFTDLSEAKEGAKLGNLAAEEFDSKVSPLAEKFEELKAKKANVPLTPDQEVTDPTNPYVTQKMPGVTSQISDEFSKLTEKMLPDSEGMKVLNYAMKRLPEQKTIGDLGQLATDLDKNYNPFNPALNRDIAQIKSVLRDAESNATIKLLGEEAPELIEEHRAARDAWKQVSEIKEDLQSKLNLKGGNYNSNNAFVKNLKTYAEENPEKFLKKIANSNDTYLSKILDENFPETAKAVKEFQLKELLGKSAAKAKGEQVLNPTTFFQKVKDLSPELRASIFSPEQLKSIEAHQTLWETLNKIDKDRNFSNTAPTLMRYLKNLPGTALGLVTAALAHNPILGAILGGLTNTIGHSAPDAMKLGFLKFMGSSAPIEPGAFKTMVEFFQSAQKGESTASKAVKGIFQSGRLVLPTAFDSEKDREKFDKRLLMLQSDPTPLFKVGGSLGHYLPDHQTALASTASSAVNYLNSLRPQVVKMNPLDPELKPSKDQTAAYHQALDIAEQPLSILSKIKEGNLTSQDMVHFSNLYPGLQKTLQTKIMAAMTEKLADGESIPYKIRMGLSLFMGQPLDSSMTPQGIQSSQMTFMQDVTPQGSPNGPHKIAQNSMKRLSSMDQTPLQANQERRH